MRSNDGDIFVVTVFAHTDATDEGKPPKTIEVRAGKKKIADSPYEGIPLKELSENAFCGRFIMVCILRATYCIMQDRCN